MLRTKQQRESFAWGTFWFILANVSTVWVPLAHHLPWYYGYMHTWPMILAIIAGSFVFVLIVMGICTGLGKWINKGEGFRDEYEERHFMEDLEKSVEEKTNGSNL